MTWIGSPPPMRGKVRCGFAGFCPSGITPAYAGKSPADLAVWQCNRDHPRLCGEKLIQNSRNPSHLGSPPPMRGKAENLIEEILEKRITPAYAGKSSRYRLISISSRDHPRLCGEKFVWRYVNYEKVGSPPPMRGKD